MKETSVIGLRAIREDGWGKVFGQAQFPADVNLPGQIYAIVVRSPHPHAIIKNVNFEKALKVQGVVSILTADDVPNNSHGVLFQDHPVLVKNYVRMVGDPIAAVGAETLEQARKAADLIEIEYEILPGLFDPEEAMKPGAVSIHPEIMPESNVCYHLPIRRGDMKAGWKLSEVIVENVYTTQMIDHAFLQPEALLAYVDERGHVVVKVSTQYAHYDRGEIAHALGLKRSQVQVKTMTVGGAFGGREDISIQIIGALMAKKTLRPVKMENTREESFYSHSKRHPIKMYYKTGADKEGKLVALEAKLIGDAGAYTSWSPNILRKAATHATGPYEIPNVHIDSYAVYTNNPFTGAMRGFGAVQPVLAYESQMELLAEKLNISSVEMRLKNIFRVGSTTATGQVLTSSVGLEACLREVMPYLQGKEDK